ncbi:MAG TPA: ORF6N domain-containing protein [Pyrinomonadaceae bacterium]|nr:ORF6N domain-containing protein [Pyrinomonadaceae bacterium]
MTGNTLATFSYFLILDLPPMMRSVEPSSVIPVERIERAIYLIRGEKVMLDRDLAELYEVETRVLNQAVGRNRVRFPPDFMFELTRDEINGISQIVTSSNLKFSKRVTAFTEQGVAMLSSVLRSRRGVQVNIEIMRAFVRLRRMLASNSALSQRLNDLESKYDRQFKVVFDAIRQLMSPSQPNPKQIGFRSRSTKK